LGGKGFDEKRLGQNMQLSARGHRKIYGREGSGKSGRLRSPSTKGGVILGRGGRVEKAFSAGFTALKKGREPEKVPKSADLRKRDWSSRAVV